ncbi:MAG TPA: tetratricopeptide repeat protein [Gemmatimonadaceae bacterium]|nr:tetratricopeptide repeat protein [Gemmatimonadaceae bacterium]
MPRMRGSLVLVIVLVACGASKPRDDATRLADARALLRRGAYDSAATVFAQLANSRDSTIAVSARRHHVGALSERGRYDDAEALARRYGGTELLVPLGDLLRTRGRLAQAESLYVLAGAQQSKDSLTAALRLGELRLERGDRAAAARIFGRFINIYNSRGSRLTSAELLAVARACRYLGADDPQLFKDALRAYDAAIAADSGNVEARIELGEMFLEKYNGPDARQMFAGVLRENSSQPRALLGMARVLDFDGTPGADSLVKRSLAVNARLVEARVMLARLRLDSEDYDEAEREATTALETDAGSPVAHALIAASRYMRDDRKGFDAASGRALERNPRSVILHSTLAEIASRNRRYQDAVDFARRAVAQDSGSSLAHGALGLNALRVGRFDTARVHLQRAFTRDPYHVWIKNTLDLLDTFGEYRETRTNRFHLIIHDREAALLSPYLLELLDEGYQKMAARYGYEPPTPIRLEVYRSHGDFSVRTVGLPGLGALGVSFGSVLAMHSPSARQVGEYNWGSTVWHELAHAFTLGMTNHRIPRWLSEGISVLEERRARPGWGADTPMGFLVAYARGRMPPVSRMNDAFTRPAFPEQIVLAYYQASLVCEMIEKQFGPRAMVDILKAYRGGESTERVMRAALKVSPEELDKRFDAYVRERFARQIAAVADGVGGSTDTAPRGQFVALITEGRALLARGQNAEAISVLERAKRLFPEHAEAESSPYRHLATAYKATGDLRRAAAELQAHTLLNESDYTSNVALAEMLETLGDRRGAAAALERAIWISPYDPVIHVRLAEHLAATGDKTKVVRERRAVVALNPVDRAEARYQLARALVEAGDRTAARREVLLALEEAPSFERAQILLLELQQEGAVRR